MTEIQKQNVEYLTSSGVYKTYHRLIIMVEFYLGMVVIILVNLWYWNYLCYYFAGDLIFPMEIITDLWFEIIIFILLPANIYGNLFLFGISVILFSALIFKIINRIQPPKEGIFQKGSKEWKAMHFRYWTAYFPIWVARALPLPWMDVICYRLLGIKIGKSVVSYEGYIDPLWVEIGDNTMTSLHICIFSHLLYHDKVLIKKVKIGKNCIIGPHTIVMPGTIIEDEAVLGANSYTTLNQHLEAKLIHVGTPVISSFPLQSLEESKRKIDKTGKEKRK
ncbi:MAG: DapH/DapD/GlmU-related protein [Promethearchaeia archaeon]